MASGATHARVAIVGLVGCLVAAVYAELYWHTQVAVGLTIGGIGGLLITPDIDHFKRTHEEYRVYRYLGSLAGKLWQAYWSPYSIFVPHRHWISHLPGVGTALRIAYVGLPFWIAGYIWQWTLPDWSMVYWSGFLAWSFQDLLHWAFDGFGLER